MEEPLTLVFIHNHGSLPLVSTAHAGQDGTTMLESKLRPGNLALLVLGECVMVAYSSLISDC